MTRLAVTWRDAWRSEELLVAAPPQTPLRDLFGTAGRLFVNGRPVSAEATLAAAGVRNGAIVGTALARPPVPVAPPGSLALLVASGASAGASCELPADGMVGRLAPLELGDEEVSGRHLRIRSSGGRVMVADAGSTNGTVVAGERLPASHGEREVAPGELIWVGRTALAVAQAPDRDAALSATQDGQWRYGRSPRLHERPRTPRIDLPEPPPEPQKAAFPWLAVAAPIVAGVLMVALTGHVEYLAFIAASPVIMVGNLINERRKGKSGYRQRVTEFEQRHQRASEQLAAARAAELAYRRHVHPDPASLLLIAAAPSRRLWERQPGDDDFLTLRVGTGAVRWGTAEQGAEMSLRDAPVTLSLPECGAVGITGRPSATRALARAMLLSAAVLHSPRDVTITVLTTPDTEADWDWLRWLPHARQPDSHPSLVRVGNDVDSTRQRLAELTALVESRRPGTFAGRRPTRPETTDIVVLDGSYRLRMAFDLAALLQEGPAVGLHFLCLDESPAQLPTECRQAVVQLSDDHGWVRATLLRPGDEQDRIAADVLSPAACETAARALAPVVDAGGRTAAGSSLPSSARLLDVAGLEPPDPQQIQARWAAGGRTTQALLGLRADGPFMLDLAQGPHLLVAGTTGSGKSELLQTLVASLAVANRPDAMNFVLIDYKGGAAFRAFRTLPHTAGMLSDLDEFLVERALVSLRAELQRRKAILDRADKTNIQRYWDALPGMPGSDPLPRLVIVVDEFAVMSEQLPEQLASLIDIGRQGRSLGIHLVLATQRPAGVVTADLRSNINLRIALRVASPEDSRDVIETVDAARIPAEGSAGRAYAWLGEGRPVAFQSARIGGMRPGGRQAQAAATVPLSWADLGYPAAAAGRQEPSSGQPDGDQVTDLSVLVDAIRVAARDEAARQRSPWSQPLPAVLAAPDLANRWQFVPDPLRLRYGLLDRPHEQRQVPAVLDVAHGGHLLVAGAPQSGRSTLLRTLAGSLAQVDPDEAHLYVLDGGGALAALSALPHCGAVVTAAEPDRVERLLGRLTAELSARTRLLAVGGHSDLAEYRAAQPPGRRPPFLLVFVDKYDAFQTAVEHIDGGRLLGELQRLIRDGLAAGVRVIVTGDRTLLTGRLGGLVEQKLVLRMADRTDFALVGLHARSIPRDMPNGRGFLLPAGDLLQVAALSAQGAGADENQALRDLARRAARGARPPFRVDPLPLAISLTEAFGLPGDGPGVLAGVGGDDLSQVRVETQGMLVIGPPRSGRSTALAVQAASLARAGTALVLVTPRRSTLTGRLNPLLHLETSDAAAVDKLTAALAGATEAVIVVDDAELLTDTPLGTELAACCRRIRDSGHRLLVAAAADGSFGMRGLVPELAKAKCGLVLAPASVTDGSVLGTRLPASVFAPGVTLRGALVHQGRITAVQVPAWPDDPADEAWPPAGRATAGAEGEHGRAAW